MATPTTDRDLLADRLFNAHSAYLISHIAPDADTLGAALGLSWSLRAAGLTVHLACDDAVPMELHFMPGSSEISPRKYAGEEVIVTVDISDEQRIGSLYDEAVFKTVPVLNIDHHITNTRFGNLNWIADVPATSEMILELLQARDVPISLEAATCLLAGIIGDTQCFITNNTTPDVLIAAATLQKLGAPLSRIATTVLNRRPASALAVWRQALMMTYQEPGIVLTTLNYEFLQSVCADDSSTNGLSSWLLGIDSTQISAVLRESENGSVDISMRSVPEINIAGAAQALGGGGHPQAAGCVINGSLLAARERLLAELRPLLGSNQTADKTAR